MSPRFNQLGKLAIALVLSALVLPGCAVTVPRIDPEGRSIFLPGSSTQLQAPRLAGLDNLNCLPKPAWSPPPGPEPCDDIEPVEPAPAQLAPPRCGRHCGLGCGPGCSILKNGRHLHRGERGKLQLTPERLVARVGSEVVLRSGVCDDEGCLVASQPIEWILTQDSVGHMVALGGTGKPLFSKLTGNNPRKVTDRFAVTHTACKPHLVTRGTPTPTDDVPIRRGESWISVTSPREGVSYVSAIAPKAVDWEERRETAIIHWIDAKWELPAPANVRTTQEHQLTTRVLSSDGAPKAGWKVRYEIEQGPEAEFSPYRTTVEEVLTDNLGEARINIRPLTDRTGVNRIKVEIIRPSDNFLEEQVVGRGWTTVRWSAPALAVDVLGPSQAEFERPVQYLIRVQNPGDLPARDVTLRTIGLPRALEFLNSLPAPLRELTDSQEWRIGDLQPGEVRTIEANYRITGQAPEILYRVEARDADNSLRAEGEQRTAIFVPSLSLDVLGPEEAEVGQEVQFEIRLRNTGRQPLTEISIQDAFDPGLRHVDDAQSPIVRDLDQPLGPGQSTSVGLTFVPQRPGYLCHTVTVLAAGGQQASKRVCLNVRARPVVPRPGVQIRLLGPDEGQVDLNDTDAPDTNDVLFRAEVTNSGNVPLSNVIVDFAADRNLLSSKEATTDPMFNVDPPDSIRWTLDQLGPGDTKLFEVRYNCERETRAAEVRVLVTADDGVREQASRTLAILPPQAAAPVQPPQPRPPIAQPAGATKITVFDQSDGIRVGESTVVTIQIENDRADWDGRLRLFVTVPAGLELVAVLPGSPAGQRSFDGQVLEFEPINTVRPGEALRAFNIRLRATMPGPKKLDVEVRSDLATEGVTASESIVVTP